MVPANILTSSNGTSWLYQGIADQSPLPNMPYLTFRGFSNQLSCYHSPLVVSYLLYWSYHFSPDCSRVPENLSSFYTFSTFLTVSPFSLDPGTLEDTSFYIGHLYLFTAWVFTFLSQFLGSSIYTYSSSYHVFRAVVTRIPYTYIYISWNNPTLVFKLGNSWFGSNLHHSIGSVLCEQSFNCPSS